MWYPPVRYALVVAFSLSIALTTAFYVAILDREPAEAAPRYEVSVWYPGWSTAGSSDYESVSKNISIISNVSPYWYALKPDGSVAAYEWAEDQKLLSLAREHDKPVTPLVTNEFDPDRVSRMVSTESSRTAHVTNLVNLVVSHGYAGLDLDYEMLDYEMLVVTSARSPDSCPSESLTFLKVSRSRNITASFAPCRSARSRAFLRRSMNRVLFGSVVRGSWKAIPSS